MCSAIKYIFMKISIYLWVLVLFFNSALASAQTCDTLGMSGCVATDLSPVGTMLSHQHPKGGWKVSYRYMNMLMNNTMHGTETVDDDFVFENYLMSPQTMRMDMHMAMAMYGFSDRFSLMLMLNYNSLSMEMTMSNTSQHQHGSNSISVIPDSLHEMSSSTSGLGDSKLYMVYSLLNNMTHYMFFSLGVSIPTGSIKKEGGIDDPMYPSKRFPYMMQMGSGSLDFMPGISYLAMLNNASLSAQIKTVVRPNNNSLGYRLGDEFTFNIWGAYQWFPWLSNSIRMEGASSKPITGIDLMLVSNLEPGVRTMNYGGKIIKSFVGLNFYVNRGFLDNSRISVEYGIPLYENVNGIQLSQSATLYLGWQVSF